MEHMMIERKGIFRPDDGSSIEVHLVINGIPGQVVLNEYSMFHGVHAPWASNSGYQSVLALTDEATGQLSEGYIYDLAIDIAAPKYQRERALPFLVGDEHRDCGWDKISKGSEGRIRIRLPKWHKRILSDCLKTYGLTLECRANEYWVFEPEVSVKDVRAILVPAMVPGTRFVDETELAKAIDACAIESGFVQGEPLSSGQVQGSLF